MRKLQRQEMSKELYEFIFKFENNQQVFLFCNTLYHKLILLELINVYNQSQA